MGLLHKAATFRAMGPLGRALYFEAALLPLAIRLGFRLWGVPQTQKALRQWAMRGTAQAIHARRVIAAALQAQFTAKRTAGVDGTCLVKTLSMWASLTRRGIATEPRWGSRKEPDGSIAMHAWLEFEGRPVNDDPAVVATYAAYRDPAWFDAPPRRQ